MLQKLRDAFSSRAGAPLDPTAAHETEFHAAWERELTNAISNRDRAEIDAIFARNRMYI
jgi:hypothetical protein